MGYACSDCGAGSMHGPADGDCICEEENETEMKIETKAKKAEARVKIQKRLRASAFNDISEEMDRQIAKFGLQNHPQEWWMAILMEEVGEASKAVLEKHFDYPNAKDNYAEELIQIAAVAISALLCHELREHLEAEMKS